MAEHKPTLIEYVGPAGAGKTTLANKQASKLRSRDYSVMTAYYFQQNKGIFILFFLLSPIFIVLRFKLFKSVYLSLKKEISLLQKLNSFLNTYYLLYKLNFLILIAKRKNIDYIIFDQGIVQKLCGQSINPESIDGGCMQQITDLRNNYIVYYVKGDIEDIVTRRSKRKKPIDIGKSQKGIEKEILLFEHSLYTVQKKYDLHIKRIAN